MNSTEKAQDQAFWKKVPAAPILSIESQPRHNYSIDNGIFVTSFNIKWNMPSSPQSSKVKLFEIYVTMAPIDGWKLIGTVRPLRLPMTANIGNIRAEIPYKVAVRAVDIHNRPGPLSEYHDILILKYE